MCHNPSRTFWNYSNGLSWPLFKQRTSWNKKTSNADRNVSSRARLRKLFSLMQMFRVYRPHLYICTHISHTSLISTHRVRIFFRPIDPRLPLPAINTIPRSFPMRCALHRCTLPSQVIQLASTASVCPDGYPRLVLRATAHTRRKYKHIAILICRLFQPIHNLIYIFSHK